MIHEKNHYVRNTDTYRIRENIFIDTFNYSSFVFKLKVTFKPVSTTVVCHSSLSGILPKYKYITLS